MPDDIQDTNGTRSHTINFRGELVEGSTEQIKQYLEDIRSARRIPANVRGQILFAFFLCNFTSPLVDYANFIPPRTNVALATAVNLFSFTISMLCGLFFDIPSRILRMTNITDHHDDYFQILSQARDASLIRGSNPPSCNYELFKAKIESQLSIEKRLAPFKALTLYVTSICAFLFLPNLYPTDEPPESINIFLQTISGAAILIMTYFFMVDQPINTPPAAHRSMSHMH